ncbi:glycosyltransferase [Pectobacterium parmentieri]|uniref:glycosyltransferase family 4 protein n=1 Tax=Pectobacterium parmentieri TaxID=1905730 RepID=UPI0004731828|nr:glycosyltransferase family 4 protein [Pectobacterium parmentieri]AYH07782.1 glucosyltransferase I RfaG [Pectobacterium parmentieri]AYH16534.1 glucosyltransferase I RfaG [Pectobacterium parmentieri]MBN3177368.1 glycosyltransferase family 4 protein [Pectobacterium parmentieri]POW25960.1 glucosyltransferase I RfaG [Pectobacterium parmentieri]PWD56978.1 glucosyltransferase I RfaG [Pectobacterium parmentieri]
MNIAICLYKYFPFGGLQRDFYNIAQACVRLGHHVRVYVLSWQGKQPENLEIIFVPASGMSNNRRNQRYSEWVQRHLQQYPVDRVVGFNKMPGLDFYYAADVCYAEKVEQEKGTIYRLMPRYRHYAAFEKAVFKRDSHTKMLMLTQRQIADFKKHYGTQDERFYILPPGIALDRKYDRQALDVRQIFRRAQGIDDNAIVLLQVGSDFKRKGVERSIRAIANLPDALRQKVIFLVVGQDKSDRYQLLANQSGIGDNVRFFAGRDDIPSFMAAADLLMHPAYQEAAGIVLLEAIVAGLPIIVTDVCGYAFYIDRAQAGAVISSPYHQASLNSALYGALNKPDTLTNWAKNARNFADTEDIYSLPEKAAVLITGE